MRRPPERVIGYFYYFTAFILSALGLIIAHPFVYSMLIASLVFIVFAVIGCFISRPVFATQFHLYLKFWIVQGLGLMVWLILSLFWLSTFPYYGDLTPFWHHPSLVLVLSAFILVNELNAFAWLMHRWPQPASVLLFFPQKKANLRLAIYGNIWFRRATMLVSFLLLLFAASNLLPTYSINALLFVLCTGLSIMFVKSPLFYRWLQIGIRRLYLNFFYILCVSGLAFLGFYFFMHWLLQPFLSDIPLNLAFVGDTAPLVVFWGFAICITVPLAFLMPKFSTLLSPRAVFLLALTNPLMWLIIGYDFSGKLLPSLQHFPHNFLIMLSVGVFILSSLWLGSQTLARLNTTFFMNNGANYEGRMPRILMQNNIPFALTLMLVFAFHAVFWLQVECLATGAYVLVAYGVSTGIYLFRLRKL